MVVFRWFLTINSLQHLDAETPRPGKASGNPLLFIETAIRFLERKQLLRSLATGMAFVLGKTRPKTILGALMRVMQHMLKRILHRLNMSVLPSFVDIYPPNILQQLKHSHSWTPAWQPASGYEAKLQSQKKQKNYKRIINRILNRLHSQPQLAFSHPCFLRVVRLQTWEFSMDSSCASENP